MTRLWLDVPFQQKDAAKAAGARWDPQARRWYAPDRRQSLWDWAPKPALPGLLPGEDREFGSGLFVDMVPSSCWFTNVRSCVDERDWERLRRMVYGRVEHRCEACGRTADRDQGIWLEAHERWAYDPETRVQTLRRLVCLCTPCHQLGTHFGLATVRGRDEEALEHLMAVNKWSRAEVLEHVRVAGDLWQERSRTDWTLDLSILTKVGISLAEPPEAAQRRVIAENRLRQEDA